MSGHLSETELSHWIVGERFPNWNRHVAECESCRAEIERTERANFNFRSNVREVGGEQSLSFTVRAPAAHFPIRATMAWSWAAALIVMCLFVAHHVTDLRPVQIASASPGISDAALLQEVNHELSRQVACPMQPLSGVDNLSVIAIAQ